MQQTNKYKLNLIERDDVFSPAALNENAQKVEGALEAVTAHADAGDRAEAAARAVLAQRVTALEAHKMVVGSYTGNGDSSNGQTINLGFTPAAVLLCTYATQRFYMLTEDNPVFANSSSTVHYYTRIVKGGFWAKSGYSYGEWNAQNAKYYFIALA